MRYHVKEYASNPPRRGDLGRTVATFDNLEAAIAHYEALKAANPETYFAVVG